MDNDKPKTPRVMRVILAISLALNLLVLGLIGGFVMKGGHDAPRVSLGLGPIGQMLAPKDRREIGQILRKRGDLKPARRSERASFFKSFGAAIRAEPFDPVAVSELLAQGDRRNATLQSAAQEAFVTQLTRMSQAERAQLAARVEQGRRR